ncbi:MerR family transcriptional regulator [Agromyces sp. NPDC056523]|uniref:MerR family transcriptional regulator n=1 Tax=Agromyces sp. NPDC056523 TaxID=3345850 RepID=UPI0036716067
MNAETDVADGRPLRTVEVARRSGYSVQQVRDLERLGVIPAAVREANGYRSYSTRHVRALAAYRGLAAAAGPLEARRLLARVPSTTLADAAAAIDAVHVRLQRERDAVERAQAALRVIRAEANAAESGEAAGTAGTVDPAAGVGARPDDAMTIGELASALGVRTSTLRFWEQEGLVRPDRVTSLRARRYAPMAVDGARIVVALRAAGYGIPAVHDVMADLRDLGGTQEADRILAERLDRISARSIALMRAGADLAAVIDE